MKRLNIDIEAFGIMKKGIFFLMNMYFNRHDLLNIFYDIKDLVLKTCDKI